MKLYHKNPRQITKKQYNQLADWLLELGDLSGIVHDLNSDEIIGGNQRSRIFDINSCDIVLTEEFDKPDSQGTVAHGYVIWTSKKYAYRQVRWTAEQCEKANIISNKGGGDFDFDGLANNFNLDDLLDWGFTEYELEIGGFDLPADELPEDPGVDVDRAEELREKWQVETGQLWQLGEHRLICGDCTDAEVVERLMGGERAQLTWTDPPYGVKYGDKLDAANPMQYRVRIIENDDLSEDELEELIRSAYLLASRFSVSGASIYAASPPGTLLPVAIAAFVGSGFKFRWQLVWVKNQLVLSRADYHFRHENILYGWKLDGAHYFIDDRKQDSVFEIPRPRVSEEHPTMKPIELVEVMIGNSSRTSEIVYDPFLGSGTTLVACQRLGRVGRGIEISPAYVAVSLQRLADMGLKPELIKD